MSKNYRHFLSSLFLLLFIWQVFFICSGFLFQSKQYNTQVACFLDEIQGDESVFTDYFVEDYSDSISEELSEEDEENILYTSFFNFKKIKTHLNNWVEDTYSQIHFQNPFSPPEVII